MSSLQPLIALSLLDPKQLPQHSAIERHKSPLILILTIRKYHFVLRTLITQVWKQHLKISVTLHCEVQYTPVNNFWSTYNLHKDVELVT